MTLKPPDPFANRHDLRLRKYLECLDVGHFCKVANTWKWKTLKARRWSAKARDEASVLAIELLRESAARWNARANEALATESTLLKECAMVESGLCSWDPPETPEPVSETAHHASSCPAYNTKGRELADQPCKCGARTPSDPEPQK